VELLILKDPDYVAWVLGHRGAVGRLAEVQGEALRLIALFDARPVVARCHGQGCEERAAYGCVYRGAVRPTWWCPGCDPHQQGATPGTLRVLATYLDAVGHVETSCNGRRDDLRFLVRALAQAKGLPERVSEDAAEQFFRAGRPAS
jgi:hypothetical protein